MDVCSGVFGIFSRRMDRTDRHFPRLKYPKKYVNLPVHPFTCCTHPAKQPPAQHPDPHPNSLASATKYRINRPRFQFYSSTLTIYHSTPKRQICPDKSKIRPLIISTNNRQIAPNKKAMNHSSP